MRVVHLVDQYYKLGITAVEWCLPYCRKDQEKQWLWLFNGTDEAFRAALESFYRTNSIDAIYSLPQLIEETSTESRDVTCLLCIGARHD